MFYFNETLAKLRHQEMLRDAERRRLTSSAKEAKPVPVLKTAEAVVPPKKPHKRVS